MIQALKIFFLLLLISPSFALGTVNVGTINIEKKWSDIYSEIARIILIDAGYKVSTQILPYPRVKQGLSDGKVDVSIMFHSSEVEKYATAIGKVRTKKLVILGHRGAKYKAISDFDNKLIAVQRGTHYFEKYNGKHNINFQLTNSYEQNIKMFMNNRADAIVGSYDSIMNLSKELGFSLKKFGEPFVISSKTSWLFVSKKSKISTEKVKASYAKLFKNGSIARVIHSYSEWSNSKPN